MRALSYISSASIHTSRDSVNSLTQALLGAHRPPCQCASTSRVKRLTSSFESKPPCHRNNNLGHQSLEGHFRHFLSDCSPPPPWRPRESKRRTRHLLVQVLKGPLPPCIRKSDYPLVEQRLRTREYQSTTKGKARGEDISGLNELDHVAGLYRKRPYPSLCLYDC